jgi:hypothetical protein
MPIRQLATLPNTNAATGAGWILIACDSLDDLPNFQAWATFVNTNERRLRYVYERSGLDPQRVKSFMRWFRALARAHGNVENAIAEMTVGDPRTLKRLREEAGLSRSSGLRPISLEQFLGTQKFVAADHSLVKTLRSLTSMQNLPEFLKH